MRVAEVDLLNDCHFKTSSPSILASHTTGSKFYIFEYFDCDSLQYLDHVVRCLYHSGMLVQYVPNTVSTLHLYWKFTEQSDRILHSRTYWQSWNAGREHWTVESCRLLEDVTNSITTNSDLHRQFQVTSYPIIAIQYYSPTF